MRVSLNLIKKYIQLPKNVDEKKIAYDLTLRTVEVENVENLGEKLHDIVVGKLLEVNAHPNADKLRICKVDIGDKTVQIVCGGSNLYDGEMVVVALPGAEVVWHGEGEPVKIKETKMRGEDSYGMICASSEVFLESFFPAASETEIVDLKDIECKPGDLIADVMDLNDTILEIDNKSLSNRPDLWGHYGIAREIATIYECDLKPLEKYELDKSLPKYDVTIKDEDKCKRYFATEIDGIISKPSPIWMQSYLVKCGLRPISAIVDITNYVMITTGQPLHAFDKTHVIGEKIIVRNAKDGEKLLLLDDNTITLTSDDLVICNEKNPMCLAGIKGGKDDSILPSTTGILLEVANFDAGTIRKTDKRFVEKTDSAIRYEKALDTQRVDDGVNLALTLIKEIFPDSKIIKYNDVYPHETPKNEIEVSESWLSERLGKKIDSKVINRVLTSLGYEVKLEKGIYKVLVPTYRSTGDVTIKDDVMGDIARILSFDSFEKRPITISFNSSVIQNDYLLERRIKEYLAYRCGFYEIFTYPWVDEKYIDAAGIDKENSIKLATPPAPELKYLKSSLIPGMIEAISKNLRYYDNFKMFEYDEVYSKGMYSPSSVDEVLPLQRKSLVASITGKDAKSIFYELKGVIEQMSRYTHMENIRLEQREKPSWADINAYLNILKGNEIIGNLGLLSTKVMSETKIKRTNVAIFELDASKLESFASRTNKYQKLPELPLIEKDLSIIIDETVKWEEIHKAIKNLAYEVEFVDEYYGDKIPVGKKSITLKVRFINEDVSMNAEQISEKMNEILNTLNKKCGAELRME